MNPDNQPPPREPDGLPPERTRSPATSSTLGLVAGFVSGLLGIGGGLIIGPGLTLLLHIRPARASGTALAAMIVGAMVAAVRYQLELAYHKLPGLPVWPSLLLALGGVVGALMGGGLARVPAVKTARPYFGLLVLLLGAVLLWGAPPGVLPLARLDQPLTPLNGVILLVLGGVVNVLAGFLGLGGGLLLIPALMLLLGYPQLVAQGTSLAVIVPATLGGTMVHLAKGNVIRSLAIPLCIGAAIGAWLTPGLTFALPLSVLRWMFGVTLGVVGGAMVLRPLVTLRKPFSAKG